MHPSSDDKPENSGGCVNQGVPGEVLKVQVASSGVEEILDPQLVDVGLRDAREHTESMTLLEEHVESVASAAKDGPQVFDTALQPLEISDTAIEKLANVHLERREEERIQKKLRDLGVCVQGFPWIKQSSGYRCAGGGHFMHNSQLY